jgi:hypothetical protein
MSKQLVEGRVLPDQDIQDRIWHLYEEKGDAQAVASDLDVELSEVMMVLDRDPVRSMNVRRGWCDVSAARWQEQEGKAAQLSNKMVGVVEGMLDHIDKCSKGTLDHGVCDLTGEPLTALIDPRSKERTQMSVTQAMQWLVETKQLDIMGRFAMNAARISESMRNLAIGDEAQIRKKAAGQSHSMSDNQVAEGLLELLNDGTLSESDSVIQWARQMLARDRLEKAQAASSLPSPPSSPA